jgi:hypothetical protein
MAKKEQLVRQRGVDPAVRLRGEMEEREVGRLGLVVWGFEEKGDQKGNQIKHGTQQPVF